ALAGLGRRQRAVVVLRYYEDRTDHEIAALLGCSESTVRSQATRALAKLRAVLPSDGAVVAVKPETVSAERWVAP
ncbi:MAG: sigma-70 family RNA polymerase sigma factor, partial [Frankia sp.]|nr:sigma-70 family RNA polymerase sigma factor [Frankia sp.]